MADVEVVVSFIISQTVGAESTALSIAFGASSSISVFGCKISSVGCRGAARAEGGPAKESTSNACELAKSS